MCQRTHLWCAGVPKLDQRQESVPEALYVNACCPSQLLSANQVTQRWTLTSPQDLPPTFFTYKPPRADRWKTDRDRLQWMSWLRGLKLVIFGQHNEAGLDRRTWQSEEVQGTKRAFSLCFTSRFFLPFISFTHLRCWIISVRANVFMHFSSCSGRFWKWCKIRMSINKIS